MCGESINLAIDFPDYHKRCLTIEGEPRTLEQHQLSRVIEALHQETELARYLLEKIDTCGTVICLENNYSYYDFTRNLIAVNQQLSLSKQVIFFVHELRHLDQAARGFCPMLELDMLNTYSLTFASEADAQAITTLYSWQVREEGEANLWNRLLGMEMYQDIALAFEEEMLTSKDRSLATRAAFEAWYDLPSRVNAYSFQTHMSYFDRIAYGPLKSCSHLTESASHGNLCLFPDGRNYGCHLNDTMEDFLEGAR